MKKMEYKKIISNLLIIIVVLGSIISIALSFNKFLLQEDYYVMAYVDCDPEAGESCFVYTCDDPEYCSEEELGSEWYFKIVNKKAYTIPYCDPYSNCEPLYCEDGQSESECYVDYCVPSEEETCS